MKEQFIEEYRQYGAALRKNIVFARPGGIELRLDLIFREQRDAVPAPVIVWVHGGGWNNHDLDRNYRPEVELLRLAAKGYVIACIDYRLSDQAPFPAHIQDCKCAIRWLRAHAAEWNLDPERIGVWGESAGGHLVNLLGIAEDVPEFEGDGGWQEYSSHVNAVCTWYSPADFMRIAAHGDPVIDEMLGFPTPEQRPAALRFASPLTYLHPGIPPFLVMHGTTDELVSPEQSELLYQSLCGAGCQAELFLVEGQGHGFFQGEEIYRRIRDFFDRTLAPRQS